MHTPHLYSRQNFLNMTKALKRTLTLLDLSPYPSCLFCRGWRSWAGFPASPGF